MAEENKAQDQEQTSGKKDAKASGSAAPATTSSPFVRLGVLGVVLLSVAALFLFMVNKMNEPNMELLFANLDLAESNKIVQKVDAMGIPTEIRAGGTQILVPSDQVARVRMVMAEAGLPTGGSVGYEIFDKTESLGTTSFVQGINKKRALEGELSRTISSISQIASARVHLVLPKKELFAKSIEKPRASIMLTMNGAGKLSIGQIEAIKHLVAAAVPSLTTENVSIIDNRGNLLASGNGEERGNSPIDLDDSKFAYEAKLSRSLESMIERVVGPGKVRVEVTADLNFDRITENAEIFDPEGKVERSVQTVEEGSDSSESNQSGGASVTAQIPGAGGSGSVGNSSKSKRTEETTNFEISKTLRTHIKESGGIKKISVAVLVDGVYKTDASGAAQYQPRPKEQLDQIATLVKSAIGYDEERKDKVEVINMPFAPIEMAEGTIEDGKIMGFERGQVVKILEVFIISFFGLLVMLLVVRPVVGRILEATLPPPPANNNKNQNQFQQQASGGNVMMMPQQAGQPNVQFVQQQQQPQSVVVQQSASKDKPMNNIEKMIQMKQIEGDIMNSTMETITKVVEENEAATVTQVRNWIYEK